MKILRSFSSAGRRCALPIILLLVAGVSMSAQQRGLQVIPDHSMARVFLGTTENPTSFDVGLAKVAGEIQFNSDDIAASRFKFNIYPADRNDQKVYGERSIIIFQSESVEPRKDGKLQVSGELTVTQTVADGPPAGSLAGNPNPMRTTHRVVFVFSGFEPSAQTSSSGASGAVPIQEDKPESGMLVSAELSVDGESFPELLFAVQDVAWPPLSDGNNCGSPSEPGQNSTDVTCAGLTSQAHPTGDHAGIQQEEPAGNLITIKFHLSLTSAESNSAKHREPGSAEGGKQFTVQ